MRALGLTVAHESWPLREVFTISRGSKTAAEVVVVTISDGVHAGRGEAVPYAHYGETVESAIAAIKSLKQVPSRVSLQTALPPGAARNAVDCALIGYEANAAGCTPSQVLGAPAIKSVLTAYTLSLANPDAMAAKAKDAAHLPLLKLKLGGDGDDARMRAVRAARPDARLIADANEAWSPAMLAPFMEAAHAARVELIEQPLPSGEDEALRGIDRKVAICADESLHTRDDLPRLEGLYDAINIKLDKAGGLTEALALKREAETRGFRIMIGSMVATSLAVAPAMILAQGADWTDLDGPLLLARDREHGISIANGIMSPPDRALWG